MSQNPEQIPYHPRQEPRIPGEVSLAHLKEVFSDCVDFLESPLLIGGDPEKKIVMLSINGMVRNERANDYILRPLAQNEALRDLPLDIAMEQMTKGALYTMSVQEKKTMDELVFDLIGGAVVLCFPGERMLSCAVPTEEKRSISPSENEPSLKGARDAFVESIRTNTSLVRRRLRAPSLKIKEQIVGRQSLTPVDILYIDGLTNPDLVKEAEARIAAIDIDALLESGSLEEYMKDTVKTPFPLMAYTERPDRFCAGLVEGRVGVIADGLPMGFLLPGDLVQFFKANEDRAKNWMEVSFMRVLRYICMLVALFLPALYVAAVSFHPEMLPASLAWSIVEAKLDVPFSTVFEVLILLLSFELVQEAGLRLPPAIGTTVSILGGLVVGTAAVQAKIVSPAVLIVVATAGIAGYTMPSQEFSGALRLWRLTLVIAAALAGLFGMMAGTVLLIYHMASLESFGVPFLTPFAATGGKDEDGVLRPPLVWVKLRERALKTKNRRNQR